MPFIFWPPCRPRPQHPGMANPWYSKLPLSQARMTSSRSPAAEGPLCFMGSISGDLPVHWSGNRTGNHRLYLEIPSSGGIGATGLSSNSRKLLPSCGSRYIAAREPPLGRHVSYGRPMLFPSLNPVSSNLLPLLPLPWPRLFTVKACPRKPRPQHIFATHIDQAIVDILHL